MRRKSEEWVKYYLDCLVKKGYLLLGYEDETEQYLSHFILQGKWEYGIVYSSVQLKYVNVIFIALKYRSSQKKSGMVSENQEL